MPEDNSAHLRKLQQAQNARQNVLDLLRQSGPMTMDAIYGAVGFRYSGTVDIVGHLRKRGEVLVTGSVFSTSRGRPVNVYGVVGLHEPQETIRERLLSLLVVAGDSPCLELSRRLGIDPKTCRYHLGRLLAARKVQVVGTIQRATGGTPAAIWSADV
jgi:predicted ArsR family transcriptional regulator